MAGSRRMHGPGAVRIGVDIGGTFTDLVLLRAGRVVASAKTLTTPEDPSIGVETGVWRLLEGIYPAAASEVVHGTTLVSNAIIERKGATTALVTTRGFRDVLAVGREHRYDLYDVSIDMPEPLVPRRLRFEVDERAFADGTVERAVDPDEVRRLARRLRREGVEAVAVSLLHSYRSPGGERTVADALAQALPDAPVSLSSDVVPELGEYVRTSTTVANAYVLPLVSRYLAMLQKRLEATGIRAPLHIMLSTGGLSAAATAARFPVRMCESGPAAGVIAAGFFAGRARRPDALAFDMGGTTAKGCLIEGGHPLIAREQEVARVYRFAKGSGLPLRVPVIDLIEIGAGGGSIARVGPFGLMKVGPESAGADPGPACYGLGGTDPTVTDADLTLGYLDPGFFLGGEMPLHPERASAALRDLGSRLGLDEVETAAGIHRVVNEQMAAALRMHAVERGRDVRRFVLVATGGAGPVHACGVARALGVRRLLFPPGAGVASAFGMLTASPAFDFVQSLPSSLPDVPWAEVRRTIRSLVAQGTRHLVAAGVAAGDVRTAVSVDARYRGQGEAVTVPLGPSLRTRPRSQVREAFEAAYEALYGRHLSGVDPEVLTWRVRVMGPPPRLRPGAEARESGRQVKGRRRIWHPEGHRFAEARVYDRYRLLPGATLRGPAVVEERESTVVLGPGATGRVDAVGNLEVEIRA